MSSQNRNYRGWSSIEEAKLVEVLVIMKNVGTYNADNGFKPGYLQYLETELKKTFPDSGILAKPHIESKMKTMRRDWQVVHDMFSGSNTSGFGWKGDTKLLDAPAEVWNAYLKVHKEASKWRNKPFPHYEDLCIIFGKDRAQGNGARAFGDVEEEANMDVQDSDEEFDIMMEGNHNAPHSSNVQPEESSNVQVQESTNVSKKRKRKVDPLVDGLRDIVNVLGETLNKAAATMSRDIDMELDLKKKRSMMTSEIFKMQSLTQQEKFESNDWLSGITNYMETVLKFLKDGLSTLHVPYSYGFAIILLTVLVKAATFPLSKKQVESAMAMRSLQPQIKAIQERYAGDQERIQLETARLYKLAGINPLAGCLPTLATIPVWIGLYRALSNVADEGLLAEGFFWIPSLAGPTTIAARQSGSGISWLFPFINGQPPLGWSDTFAYLVLPVLLVVSQYISVQIMQSSQPQSNDPNMKTSQTITKFLPLMIGYFALSVPSGLSLYWLTNNILSSAQQIWLQKMGGANNPAKKINYELLKEERPKIEEPVFQTTSVKEKPKIEKTDAQGYRPGERFKQLKEQEAKRKRQKEAEKAKEISLTNGNVKVDREVDVDSMKSVNGDPSSSLDSNQVEKTVISGMEDGKDSVRYSNGTSDKQFSDENLDKEKATKSSSEDKHRERA